MRLLSKLRHCTSGSVAIEFAVAGAAMVVIGLGILEFGRALYVKNEISYAADLAVRDLLIKDTIADGVFEIELGSGHSYAFQLGTSPDAVFRTLSIEYPFRLLIPGLSREPIMLTLDRRIPVV